MHEAAIAKDVLTILEENCASNEEIADRDVTKITFTVGRPYTVYPDSFEFYFVELIKGTRFEKAEIIFEEVDEQGFFIKSFDIADK